MSTALRSNALTRLELTATSMASIAPAIGTVFLLSSIVAGIGIAVSLAVIVGAIGFILHINTTAEFSRSIPSAGGYSTFLGRTFGGTVGAMTGMMYIIAGLGIAIALVFQLGIFTSDAFAGIFGHSIPWWLPCIIIVPCLGFLMARGIVLSVRVAVTLFAFELTVITISSLAMLIVNHAYISSASFDPRQMHEGVVGLGAAFVLAIFLYTGASTPAPLAEEANKPHRTIPFAVLLATVVAAGIYALTSWSMVISFHGNESSLSKAALPFLVGASRAFSPMGDLLYLAGFTSAIAVLMCDFNSFSRVYYNMSREGILPSPLATIHEKWKTPWIAVSTLVTIALVVALVVGLMVGAQNGFNYLATLGTLAFIFMYLASNAALPFYYSRQQRAKFSKVRHVLWPVLGIIALAYPLWETVQPAQPAPYNWFWAIGAGFLVVAVIYGLVMAQGGNLVAGRFVVSEGRDTN